MMLSSSATRIALFDRARGLAVLLMVFANATPILGTGYIGPWWLRVLCSVPAPLFVILAGMMVAKTAPTLGAEYYIKRGAILLIIAAAINVFIHQSPPFQNIEILYLMGLSIPITYFIHYLPTWGIILFCIVSFITAQFLQITFPFDLSLLATYPKWQLWFINGWFPLLPWTGIMAIGLIFYRFYINNLLFTHKIIKISMLGLFISGSGLCYFYPVHFITPWGYQELFYPPSLAFGCISIPVIWIIFYILNKPIINLISTPIELLGQHSLLVYVLHLAIIFKLIGPYFFPISSLYGLSLLIGLSIVHMFFLIGVCFLIQNRVPGY